MKKHPFFRFGETKSGYSVPVLNEREVRGAAGILFAGAFFSFMNALLVGNYFYIKLFIVTFFVDFTVRLFVNPRYAPSMILARLFVGNQKPEYTGAPQKRFAWYIGFALSIFMLAQLVLLNQVGPINLIVCLLCLTFLFFESVFGICIGCLIYGKLYPEQTKYCPGGVCEIPKKK